MTFDMRPMRQAGWRNPPCLSVIILHTISHYTHFDDSQRTSVIKTVSSFKATLAPVTVYNKFRNHFNLSEGTFLFYRLSII